MTPHPQPPASTDVALPIDVRAHPSAAVLVDFQNIFFNLANTNSFEWLPHEINTLISDAVRADPAPDGILVRLYGSWREDGMLTKQGSLAQQAIGAGPSFPLIIDGRIVHGAIELSLSLTDVPSLQWYTFVKRQKGLSRIKIAKSLLPQACRDDRTICPVRSLQHFASHRTKKCLIEECPITNRQAFETTTQKLVDTFLACDLVAFARRNTTRALVLVTGDVDLMPAIVTAASLRGPSFTLITASSEEALEPYVSMLEELNVTVIHRSPQ